MAVRSEFQQNPQNVVYGLHLAIFVFTGKIATFH